MSLSASVATALGAVVALLLQVALAPVLAIGGIVPNLLLAYGLAVALARPYAPSILLPFALGFAFDLVGGGAVGAMALLLMLASVGCRQLARMLDNDTLFVPLGLLVAGVLLVELLYGALLVLCGYPASLGEALLFRSLPCALYDGALAVLLFFLLRFALGQIEARQRALPLVR